MVLLPLILAQRDVAVAPLTAAEIAPLALKAERYLELAHRLDDFPQPLPLFRRFKERPRYSPSELEASRGQQVEFDVAGATVTLQRSDGSLRWLTIDPYYLAPIDARLSVSDARQVALDYYNKLGGHGVPTVESTPPQDLSRYAPSRDGRFTGVKPFCFNLVHYAEGFEIEAGGWHLEMDPSGRLLDIGTAPPPPPVEGPLTGLVTRQQAMASAAAAIVRMPGAPLRFTTACDDRPHLQLFSHPGWLTEFSDHDRDLIVRKVAFPVYRAEVMQEPQTSFRGQMWPVFWGVVVDARDGRTLAISGRCDPLNESIGLHSLSTPAPKPAAFPMAVTGLLAGSKLRPAKGNVQPAAGTLGKAARSLTLAIDHSYRAVLFDPASGLVGFEGKVGRPDAALLKSLRSAPASNPKPFGKP